MNIEVSPIIYDKCAQFACERIGGSADLYKQRGENSISKMEEDILNGALGEFAAYEYLKSKGIKASKPDLEIYSKKDKSFSADLQAKEGLFHVKSQGIISARRYNSSWLCQKTDPLLICPESNDYFVFCIVEGDVISVKAVVKAQDLLDNNLIGEPKVWSYRHSKVALYLEDILASGIELWRF